MASILQRQTFYDRSQSSEDLQSCTFDSPRRGYANEHNPVTRYLVEPHAPVHEGLVTSPKTWKMICSSPDRWHVMAGPIVSQGKLVGAVGCTRDRSPTSAIGNPNYNYPDSAPTSPALAGAGISTLHSMMSQVDAAFKLHI